MPSTQIGFLQSVNHYDASRSLETYMFTILRYKLFDQLRSRKIEAINAPADDEDWWDQVLPRGGETPSGAAVKAEAGLRTVLSTAARPVGRICRNLLDQELTRTGCRHAPTAAGHVRNRTACMIRQGGWLGYRGPPPIRSRTQIPTNATMEKTRSVQLKCPRVPESRNR